MIEAAGGVVWRATSAPHVEVLVIHRPHRDDWSLPKGKRRRRESSIECAVREVREETGFRCSVGPELPETRYFDRKGRLKRVRYWAMHEIDGQFHPNAEVDEIRWMRSDRIAEVLTSAHDLIVVAALRPLHATVA